MSTKAIREALETLKNYANHADEDGDFNLALAALAELEAIEKAARDIEAWQVSPAHDVATKMRLSKSAGDGFDVLSRIANQER